MEPFRVDPTNQPIVEREAAAAVDVVEEPDDAVEGVTPEAAQAAPEPEPAPDPTAEPAPEAEGAVPDPDPEAEAEREPEAAPEAEAAPDPEPNAEAAPEHEAESTTEPRPSVPDPDLPSEPVPGEPEPLLPDEPDAVAEPVAADEVADAPAADAEHIESEPEAAPVPPRITAEEPDHEPEHEAEATAPVQAEPATVAELVAATLRAAGVRIAFTVAGESFLAILDALNAAGIRVVATRHEGAAAFAAEAYGQLTGRPAVCLGTRAVGATNLAIGIHTATADSTPMFVIVGDVARGYRGREAFQEIDQVATIGALAKWAGRIDDAETAAATLEAAVRATVEGRPGPALIAIAEDVQSLSIPEGTRAPVVRPHPETPSVTDMRAVLNFLASAERPLILAGAGVLRARCSNDLVRFAELLHVPVVAAWRRGDVIPNDHALFLGMAGFGSPGVVRERIEAADALLVLGSRLNEPTSFEYRIPVMGQRWMHVDLEPRTGPVGFASAPELAIRADARAFLRAANARLKEAVLLAAPVKARDANNASDRAAWEAAAVVDDGDWSGPGVHPGRIIADLRRLLPEDAIVTTDAGAFGGWTARGFRFKRPGTFLGPTSGAMGYGFPAALAAALVHRERRVVALVGDGGMGMTLAEVETAVREGAHVVAIVFDNERYGMIRGHQDRQGSPTSPGTDLGPLDFAAAARACGARGVRVETDAAFEGALRTALAASGPTVIQVSLDRRWASVDRPAYDEGS
ncbi:MAG TPA: thiamine pyrophosphate-dependent enzyme [Candidatus Limnocylindrales bacterium]|nr:thiamine pyrophosphate-dependent enzyme [Candidatus Limnocylindrales bacterium]